jgi:hypothetical protein
LRQLRILLITLALGAPAAFGAETATPHDMLLADGKPDTDKCALCHEEDFSLSRTKLETCTLCHATTVHSGANEHVRAEPAQVARLIPPPRQGEPVLPLTEDGRIYCGTCHVFHDPRISEEKVLDQPWVPSSPLGQAVRESLVPRLEAIAPAQGEEAPSTKFSDGTKRLRLPIADGALCRHCHGFGK